MEFYFSLSLVMEKCCSVCIATFSRVNSLKTLPIMPSLPQERLIGEIEKLRNEIDHLKRRSGVFGDGTHPRYTQAHTSSTHAHPQTYCFLHDNGNLSCVYNPRSHLGSSSDLRFSVVEGQDGHYSTTVIRRAQKGRLSALRDDPNKVLIMFLLDQNYPAVFCAFMHTMQDGQFADHMIRYQLFF